MIAAFVVGIVSGAITVAYVLSVPSDVPLFTFRVQSGVLLWLSLNSRIIVSSALSLLMTFGIIIIVGNVREILRNFSIFAASYDTKQS